MCGVVFLLGLANEVSDRTVMVRFSLGQYEFLSSASPKRRLKPQ